MDGFTTKTYDEKLYYWCPNHNNDQGKWVLHHLTACNNNNSNNNTKAQMTTDAANVAAFDTVDSDMDSDKE